MSDQITDEFDNEERETPAQLREAAERGRKAAEEAEGLRRENAFLRAGIDTTTKRGQVFADSYKGDLEADAIRGEYAAVFGEDKPSEPEGPSAEELEAQRRQTQERRDITGAGGDITEPPPPNLKEQGYKEFEEALANGMPMERAFRHVLSGHIAAANADQTGAVWKDKWTDEQLDTGSMR